MWGGTSKGRIVRAGAADFPPMMCAKSGKLRSDLSHMRIRDIVRGWHEPPEITRFWIEKSDLDIPPPATITHNAPNGQSGDASKHRD
jgi:hypothetical protein